uniref:Uncharacterized protein n=1 Tax=Amphilophus citrinellus TaxID=61819 RepID=A0A3Q0SS92_AMPCI
WISDGSPASQTAARRYGSSRGPSTSCGKRRTSGSTSTGTASPSSMVKLLPQSSQVNGFSPTWNSVMWDLRWDDCVNLFPQVVQRKGRSPVWVTMCALRWGDCVNLLPHSEHLSSWVRWWQRMPLSSLKALPQVGHLCGFLLECVTWWSFRL